MPSKQQTVKKGSKNPAVPASLDEVAYESDFYKWTRTQVNLLRKEEFEKLDIRHLIEEIAKSIA